VRIICGSPVLPLPALDADLCRRQHRKRRPPATPAVSAETRRQAAQERALEKLRREVGDRYGMTGTERLDEFLEEIPQYTIAREHIMAPGWVPQRPSRTMPALWVIARYWHRAPLPVADILAVPYCFRCGRRVVQDHPRSLEDRWNAAVGYLERAHLVDRIRGGLDGPQNLMPLCHRCHKIMPSFDPGEGPDAIAWVLRGGRCRLRIVHDGDVRKFAHLVAEAQIRRQLVGD
jgi:hypothetical protein